MKNFNRCSAHDHHGSKHGELLQHTHSTWIAIIYSHAYFNSYNHMVQSASSAITEFGIKFLFWRYLRNGEYLEKNPDSLPGNRYHILEEKIQRPNIQYTSVLYLSSILLS